MDRANNYLKIASDFATALQNSSLTMNDLCRLIAISTFEHAAAESVSLVALDDDGYIRVIASFGLDREIVDAIQHLPLETDLPSTRAIRFNKIVYFDGMDTITSEFPTITEIGHPHSRKSAVAIPIRKVGSPIGALVISGTDLPLSENGLEFLEVMSSTIGLWYLYREALARQILTAPLKIATELELTHREHLIQGQMARGWTNLQIAEDLGFSNSTIRQDGMSLFAKLGVHTRKEAGDLYVLPNARDGAVPTV